MTARSLAARTLALAICFLAAASAGAQSEAGEIAATTQRALSLLSAGRHEQAEALLREVIAVQPRHGTARMQLGILAFERGDLTSAVEHLQIATTSNPQRLYLAWSVLGRAHLLRRESADALMAFGESLALAPRFAPALIGRGRALLFLRRPDEALLALEAARELGAPSHEAALLTAQLLVLLDRPNDARALLASAAPPDIEVAPDVATAAAMLRLALDATPEAAMELRLALGRNLSLADGYLAFAIDRWLTGERAEALSALRIALAIDDTNPIPALFLERATGSGELELPPPAPGLAARLATAHRHSEEGRGEDAARIAAGIVSERPFCAPARLLVLRDAERQGDLWEVLTGYRLLLDWLPGLPALESRLADVAHAMGAEELAECAVRRALAGFPREGALHYRLATILAARGETESALAAAERALTEGFESAQAWLLLGRLHLDRMDVAPALDAYGTALELDPEAAEVVGSFALASLTTDEFAGVRELLERHAAAHPDNADTLYSLGVMTLRQGELERAERYFLEVAQQRADESDLYYNLAQLYRRMERPEESRRAMARFNELKAREEEEWLRHNRSHALRLEARDAMASDNVARALELYRQLVATGTAQLEDYATLGDAYLATGSQREALALFTSVLATTPYERRLLEGLERAARKLGDMDAARQAREKLDLLTIDCRDISDSSASAVGELPGAARAPTPSSTERERLCGGAAGDREPASHPASRTGRSLQPTRPRLLQCLSPSIRLAASAPGAQVMPPPGWLPLPHRKSPGNGDA